jgi:pyrroloquinoline-quinone synthase
VSEDAWTPSEFLERLRAEGARRYHDKHPFNLRMHAGELSRAQLQGWVLNRYYYQTRIPIKDAVILSRSEDPAFRRRWIHRIRDHDGDASGAPGHDGDASGAPGHDGDAAREGGLEQWLRLAQAVGLDRDEVASLRRVLPQVRFACDAYVQFVRERSLVEAVASSLTEFFSPDIMTKRLEAWRVHYPWVDVGDLEYFRSRVSRARADSTEALDYVREHAKTRASQEACLAAFTFKCDVLWALLDAVTAGYPE